jgi:hypothetical protein
LVRFDVPTSIDSIFRQSIFIPMKEIALTCADYIALAKDLILSLVAIVGATVAVKGLGTWQRQLKGRSEYDLSRRLLVSLYKYRDAIYEVREPAMLGYEMPKPPDDEAEQMQPEKIRFYGTSKAHQARWNKVQHERAEMYADLLEARALWGDELEKLFRVNFELEHELFIYLRSYLILMDPETEAERKEAIQRINAKRRDVMYDDMDDEGDEYKKEFTAGIESIEKYLKPKLVQ